MNKKLFVIILILLFTLFGCNSQSKDIPHKKEVLKYLKQKYKQDFKIKRYKYDKRSKSYQYWISIPKEISGVEGYVFNVYMLGITGQELTDNYANTRVEVENIGRLKKYVDMVSERNLYTSNLPMDTKELRQDAKKMNFEELKNKHSKDIRCNIWISYFIDINEENVMEVSKKVYELVKFLKKDNLKETNILIEFLGEKRFRKFKKIKDLDEYISENDGIVDYSLNLSYIYVQSISEKEIFEINSVEDVYKKLRISYRKNSYDSRKGYYYHKLKEEGKLELVEKYIKENLDYIDVEFRGKTWKKYLKENGIEGDGKK